MLKFRRALICAPELVGWNFTSPRSWFLGEFLIYFSFFLSTPLLFEAKQRRC